MKFIEGEEHDFQVIKLAELPDEGFFYVLRHSSTRRLLLPYETYKYYKIEIGTTIICRIDRVNCTGNVFLEPKHPIYVEGLTYDFPIVDHDNSFITVSDCFANEIKVEIPERITVKGNLSEINLKVLKVKKGKPILSVTDDNRSRFDYLIGKSLVFLVTAVVKNNFDEDVYILKSNSFPKAELKVRHYLNYGFTIGNEVEAKVLGINEDGFLKVEPKNPFYNLGELYEFTISFFEESEASGEPIVVVNDNRGAKIGVPITEPDKILLKEKTRVLCRVIGFRKGKPKLKIDL
jgi:hypothetical protein